MDRTELIRRVRSGIIQIQLQRAGEGIAAGSGFLVDGGLVTNSHVLRDASYESVLLRPADTDARDPASYVRLLAETVEKAVAAESPVSEGDFIYLRLWQPEFDGRHRFGVADSLGLAVGEEVVFLGFPFGMSHLTAHVGFVSSAHQSGTVRVLQIDGSINGGNSGGPLIDLKTGQVAAVVTRAETGLIKRQFDDLFDAFQANRRAIDVPGRPRIALAGFDPTAGFLATQAAIEVLAQNIRRSANVGIGYAFCAGPVRDAITLDRSGEPSVA